MTCSLSGVLKFHKISVLGPLSTCDNVYETGCFNIRCILTYDYILLLTCSFIIES